MKAFTIALAAGAVLWAAPVAALPAANLAAAASDLALQQNVRWVCGRHRCWWRGGDYRPRASYGYGPGFYSHGPSLYGYAPGWLGNGPAWYAGGYGAGLYGRWW